MELTAISQAFLPGLAEIVPEFTELEPFRDRNLNSWRTKGSHSLVRSTAAEFILQVNQREFGATIFAEAQHLLNQASEQRAHIFSVLEGSKNQSLSPSWLFVTLYYMSLYAAMTWTRVANSAVIYLDKDAIQEYCGKTGKQPGGGAFQLKVQIDPSTSISHTNFRKCNQSHFHEAVWVTTHNIATETRTRIEATLSNRHATSDELLSLRGLKLFEGHRFTDPLVWQSKVRNGINYRPGFSYRSILKHNFLHTEAKLSKGRLKTLENVISLGESAKAKLTKVVDPFTSMDNCIDLLISQTLFLEAACETALRNICSFRDLRSSAFSSRKKFQDSTRQQNMVLDVVG